ncbi:SGNH/GDSL hydrolase family protein [Caulobacter sp.]|uniref:SGNH/GDSL hydrolase family protein n=1 Tax=Caulobacter sp. TaxID=78 RepID=UPI001B026491|nr:SGNH/GDSL hydrolase family protein [Caulobacter sp.]MBO9544312.1 SGNH/GDSL hydrolase family protein [Caulobacter sp.]
MKARHVTAACLAVSLIASQALAADRWLGAWGFAPVSPNAPPPASAPNPAPAPAPAPPATQQTPPPLASGPSTVADVTIRQLVRVSAAGTKVRVRLSNEFGTAPIVIGKAAVAPAKADGSAGEGKALTFGGQAQAMIYPGAPLYSDPVDLPVAALQELAVSLYLPEETKLPTHSLRQTLSDKGDFTTAARFGDKPLRLGAIVSGVEVASVPPRRVIVTLGDSITEGAGSTPGAYQSWPDLLAVRLAGRAAVVNVGISGNRVLRERSGPSALARFDRDVLSVPGATDVVLMEGINDINRAFNPQYGERANADDLIGAYKQIILRAHAKGLRIHGATLTPQGGYRSFSPQTEATRQAVNAWIRTSGAFDGVIDFDAAVRDPKKPDTMVEAYQSGDWLHPGDAGYKVMAAAVDLRLFGVK